MIRLLLLILLAAPLARAQDAPEAPPEPRRVTSLFADLRAVHTGDLVTVILAERTQARRASASQGSASASVGGAGTSSGGGVFGVDAQVGGQRASENQTAQSELLTGTLTARVVGVDPAGNLLVEGERRLNVDGATHRMRVRGAVRRADVTAQNTVLSHQIAGAEVEYAQEGGSRFLRPRFLTVLGVAAVLVGAAVLGGAAASAGAAPVAAAAP